MSLDCNRCEGTGRDWGGARCKRCLGTTIVQCDICQTADAVGFAPGDDTPCCARCLAETAIAVAS